MAEATPLEQTAKAASQIPQQEKKEEQKKPIGTLESVVNDLIYGAKTFANIGLAIGTPLAFGHAFPAMKTDAYALTGAQIAGDATTARKRGEKFTSFNALESSLMGLALTPVAAHPTFGLWPLMNKIPTENLLGYATKAAVLGAVTYPIYFGAYQIVDYLIKNKTFKGLGKYLKENYFSAVKTAWKTAYLLSLANVLFLPLAWQIPVGAALNYIVSLFGAPKKGEVPAEKKRDKTPYYVAASNVTGRLVRNTAKGFYEALYAIGSGLKNTLYSAAPKPAAPAQQPA